MSAVTSAQSSVALRATTRRRTPMQRIRRLSFWALVVALALFCLFPFYWALVSSLKGDLELFQTPPTFYPHNPTLISYNDVIFHRPFPRNILNSFVVSTANTVLSLAVGTFCAYALARLHFRGRSLILG